eukprot:10870507-Lingulodinium_polyedra.AAC.1
MQQLFFQGPVKPVAAKAAVAKGKAAGKRKARAKAKGALGRSSRTRVERKTALTYLRCLDKLLTQAWGGGLE